jgi:hypothetical protein
LPFYGKRIILNASILFPAGFFSDAAVAALSRR